MNRRDVYNKYDGHCAYCGTRLSPLNWGKPPRGKGDDMTIDHIVPTSKGGSNTLENAIPSCHLCNGQKADRSVEEFRSFIENITETLDEDKQYRLALRYKKVVPVKPNPVTFYFENHK